MNLPPDSHTQVLAGWTVAFVVLALWQLTCLVQPRLPSLSTVVTLLVRSRLARWLLLAGWFWWGWHVWVRGGW